MVVRAIVQQSHHIDFKDNKDQWVHIRRGIVVYICFLKGANESEVEKCVQTLLNVQICFHEEHQKHVSITELGGDILYVPQASLAGKPKGSKVQYHSLIDKQQGAILYDKLVQETLQQYLADAQSSKQEQDERKVEECVKWGTYGNRQGMKIESSGPYTHSFEFDSATPQ